MDGFQAMTSLNKALSHPIRLQILTVLSEEGESCVCHLEYRLQQRQAYISQQLAKLRDADLVTDRREGMNVFYDLAHPAIAEVIQAQRDYLGEEGGETITFEMPEPDPGMRCGCPKCTPGGHC